MSSKPVVRVPANLAGPMFTADGFVNAVSRVGTGADKAYHGTYNFAPGFVSPFELEAAYRTSWFRKIVDVPPFDETREWRTWSGADEDQITPIYNEEVRLGLQRKIKQARTLARKDGGAAILIGDGSDGSTELRPEMIGRGGLKWIKVLSRHRIHPGPEIMAPDDPYTGEPEYYTLSDGYASRIHPSRVIRFLGNPILQEGFWSGWGDSIWVEMRDAIRRVDQVSATTAALLDEAKIDVVRLNNLANNLSTAEGENLLIKRWGAMGTLKSVISALILDKDDEYDQKTLDFAGLDKVNALMLLAMSGMADIPQTRLYGRSPQGMNATGDSDLRNYYDRITAFQKSELGPLLMPLDEMLIRSAIGSRPPEVYYEWSPLYTLTEKEQADIEKTYAETVASYVNSGVIPDTALTKIAQNGITNRGNFPGAETAFSEAEAEGDMPGLIAEPDDEELAAEQARIAAANPSNIEETS